MFPPKNGGHKSNREHHTIDVKFIELKFNVEITFWNLLIKREKRNNAVQTIYTPNIPGRINI